MSYQPFYCEENVWQLLAAPPAPGQWFALFIANAAGRVALWQQRLAPPGQPMLWDYHVVAVRAEGAEAATSSSAAVRAEGAETATSSSAAVRAEGAEAATSSSAAVRAEGAGVATASVWDRDSRLPCPCPLARYLAETFRSTETDLAPRFRLVAAAEFAARFATDRRHMRRADGSWQQPPPPWPPPAAPGETHNLQRFLDFGDPIAGEVLSLAELRARFEARAQ